MPQVNSKIKNIAAEFNWTPLKLCIQLLAEKGITRSSEIARLASVSTQAVNKAKREMIGNSSFNDETPVSNGNPSFNVETPVASDSSFNVETTVSAPRVCARADSNFTSFSYSSSKKIDNKPPTPKIPIDDSFASFAELAKEIGLAVPAKLSKARRTSIGARLKEHGSESWGQILENIKTSKFLSGGNDRGWQADLDWVLKPANYVKVLEGKYKDPIRPATSSNGVHGGLEGSATARQQMDQAIAYVRSLNS